MTSLIKGKPECWIDTGQVEMGTAVAANDYLPDEELESLKFDEETGYSPECFDIGGTSEKLYSNKEILCGEDNLCSDCGIELNETSAYSLHYSSRCVCCQIEYDGEEFLDY